MQGTHRPPKPHHGAARHPWVAQVIITHEYWCQTALAQQCNCQPALTGMYAGIDLRTGETLEGWA